MVPSEASLMKPGVRQMIFPAHQTCLKIDGCGRPPFRHAERDGGATVLAPNRYAQTAAGRRPLARQERVHSANCRSTAATAAPAIARATHADMRTVCKRPWPVADDQPSLRWLGCRRRIITCNISILKNPQQLSRTYKTALAVGIELTSGTQE
jgi:hypothetical protein